MLVADLFHPLDIFAVATASAGSACGTRSAVQTQRPHAPASEMPHPQLVSFYVALIVRLISLVRKQHGETPGSTTNP